MSLFRAEIRQGDRLIASWSTSKEPIEIIFYQDDFPVARMNLQAPEEHEEDDFTLPLPEEYTVNETVRLLGETSSEYEQWDEVPIPRLVRQKGDDFTLPFPEDSEQIQIMRLHSHSSSNSDISMKIWRFRNKSWSVSGALTSNMMVSFFAALITINREGGICINGPIEASAERLLDNGERVAINSDMETIHLPVGEGLLLQDGKEAVMIRPPSTKK